MHRWLFVLLAAAVVAPAGAVEKIALHALFKDKAIIVIDGTRRVLEKGATSPEGVRLIATDTAAEQAELEIDGKRQTIRLGMVMASFQAGANANTTITLYPDRGGHYLADGAINGVAVRFLVDTGATTVTMSGATARRIGLDYRGLGARGFSQTAAGVVPTYAMKLNSVQVGDATVHNVDGGVIEGMQADEVLLGMSFLGRFDMKRDSEKMELTQRY